MKNFLIIVMLFLASSLCGAQPFFNNGDYIYGTGISKSEYAADSLAVISFSRSIGMNVSDDSTYEYEESGKTVKSRYSRRVSMKSEANVFGAKKYASVRPDGKYEVWYYINKREYVEHRMSEFNRYCNEAKLYKEYENPHSENLYLGSLYLAYSSVNDWLLNAIYPKSISYRDSMRETIEMEYKSVDVLLSVRRNGGIHYLIRDENCRSLPGFEYFTTSKTWVCPNEFMDYAQRKSTDLWGRKWALAENVNMEPRDKVYRILYEEEVEGVLVKIQVPDDFYYPKYL